MQNPPPPSSTTTTTRKHAPSSHPPHSVSKSSIHRLHRFVYSICVICGLKVCGVEGVALADVAGFVTFFEPAQALFGGSVSEGVGDDGAGCATLDLIVADGAGGA